VFKIQKINLLCKKFRSEFRWAVVGGFTFIIDYIIFLLIYANISSVVLSNFCSGLVSIIFNYFAHYKWSFKSKRTYSNSSFRYTINLLVFWLIGTLTLKYFIASGISPRIAKIITVPIFAPLSYFSLKNLVFKKVK